MRSRLAIVSKLMGALLLVYTLLRMLFLFSYFNHEGWTTRQLAGIFYWGLRLDFSALFYINLPFVVYYLFIGPFIDGRLGKRIALYVFCLFNLAFLALNFIDLVYYHYNHRRSTVDLLDVFTTSSSAFGSFLIQYWYVALAFIITGVVLARYGRRCLGAVPGRKPRLLELTAGLFVLAIAAGFARGFSERPLLPSTPLLYSDARYQPLVSNSSFNFLYSVFRKQTSLEKKHYFPGRQPDSLFTTQQYFRSDSPFSKRNVVIFVLESFSKEFFHGGGQEAKMPFFDSLMQHSTVFNNAFANALESNKGLPAILASLPDVMDEPIYLSNYSNLRIRALGHILEEQGYNTSFFMGAGYDHFGFAKLCRMVGIDEYYSRDTYGKHPEQYDGTWGIYDEYFFDYFGKTISKKRQPFFSVLFNLSSHTPYKIPAETTKKIHVPGQQPHQDSKTYVDHCFRQLFRQVSAQPWFRNTIFVFVADHGYRFTTRSDEMLKELRIPLFIYDPQRPVHTAVDKVVKQLDIVPSVLDLLNYTGRYTGFGSSFYRPGPGFSVNRLNGVFQYLDSAGFFGYDDRNERLLFHYRYPRDPLLQRNLLPAGDSGEATQVRRLKAFLQVANNCLVNNGIE